MQARAGLEQLPGLVHGPELAHQRCARIGEPTSRRGRATITFPMRTRPSRLYLPKFDSAPPTIFEYLLARFPQINATIWRDRLSRGLITLSDGTAVYEDSPYRHGATVFYRKEVPSEPAALEDPLIVYRDDEILVADKPHGMPATPSG